MAAAAKSPLLPKNVGSFADAAYWREFFKRRGEKAFEWYGSYSEIGQALEKYLKPTDRILQIGCGNSTLADDLYDNGFRRVINIDIVRDVIDQQRRKNKSLRPELEYFVCDVTSATTDRDQNDSDRNEIFRISSSSNPDNTPGSGYQVVLDKGTLDALLSPADFDHPEMELASVTRMFDQVDRSLAIGGRYLVISMAQPEVIRVWTDHFRSLPYMIRIQQLNVGGGNGNGNGWTLPTFLFVATKLRKSIGGGIFEILEYGSSTMPRRFQDADQLLDAVKSAQEYAIFCDKARRGDLISDQDLHIDLHSPNSSSTSSPRYTVYLAKAEEKTTKKKFAHQYAVFVVPQGREHEWLFSTAKGRRELCSQASARQLAVVHLHRDHEYPNLEAVKRELDERVMDFAPAEVTTTSKAKQNRQVPYLSLGEDIGNRVVIKRGNSAISGEFVVEDVHSSADKTSSLRRLVFLKSQNLIQSEAQLLPRKGKNKKNGDNLIDWSRLCCDHHELMLAAFDNHDERSSKIVSICLLGLGGGCLATYILKHFQKVTVTAVELDQAIVDVARECFELPRESDTNLDAKRLKIVVGDGLNFLREMSESCFSEADKRFDVILLDVAGDSHVDGLSCPIPAFVEDQCLERLRKILHQSGCLAMNLVARDEDKRREVKNSISRYFPQMLVQKVPEELNEVLLCFCEEESSPADPPLKSIRAGFQTFTKT